MMKVFFFFVKILLVVYSFFFSFDTVYYTKAINKKRSHNKILSRKKQKPNKKQSVNSAHTHTIHKKTIANTKNNKIMML